jgi:hypothetical protein
MQSQISKASRPVYHDDDVVDVGIAAAISGLSASTLNKRRLTGDSVPFYKIGRSVRYRVADIREWLLSKRARSTSEYGRRDRGAA